MHKKPRFTAGANEMVSPIPTKRYAEWGLFFGRPLSTVTLIGIDLGKHSFHLHGQDAAGRMMFRKKCSRQDLFKLLGNTPRSTVVMEACAGAHWMARRIEELGHQAKLISPVRAPLRTGQQE